MEMSISRLRKEILPEVFSRRDSELLDCIFDATSKGQDQLMSNVVFLTAVVHTDKRSVKIPLVVKFEPFNVQFRDVLQTSIQFFNEVFMYSKILPFLNKLNICEETFPEFFHGAGEIGGDEEAIVILEDLRPSGYRLTEERVFLDFDHLFLAVSKLGRFHALSYAAKKQCPKDLSKLTKGLKETFGRGRSIFRKLIKQSFHRPAEYLMKQGKHTGLLQRLLESFDLSATDFIMKLLTPTEPMAVICHGDFCRNNILYRYSESGRPADVRFFDIATSRYASPVIDLSFFLLFNSDKTTRDAHWDDLLSVYHRTLSTAIPGLEVPSLQDVREEVKRRAMYGYVLSSFFLPAMAYKSSIRQDDVARDRPYEEIEREFIRIGGEECTRLLADMLEELIERGCVTLKHDFM